MKEFMQTHKIYLTPISPIHIGCGEDFEPTNYVVDNQVLYHFEPSRLCLSSAQKSELLNKVRTLKLLEIQRFFLKYKEEVSHFAHYFVNLPKEIAQKWQDKIGKVVQNENEGDVINKLAIERTAYLPYQHSVYIPGSSFKGALATAFLNFEHQKSHKKHSHSKSLNKELLKEYIGEFKESKFRTVKFADFMPINYVNSQAYYALNYKKVPTEKGIVGKGVSVRRECVMAGQYRAFQSELLLWENEKNNLNIKDYFQILNEYYQPIFEKECERLMANNLISRQWVKEIRTLCAAKNVALIRLGKSGADSKVYQDSKLTQIKIMRDRGQNSYESSSTTVWLAGIQEKQRSELLPFGWAILEFDPQTDNTTLKQWCEQQVKPDFNPEAILAKRKEIAEEKQKQLAQEQAKREEEKQAEEAKQAMLNSLNANQKAVMDFVQDVENTRERQADTSGSVILKNLTQLIETAINWTQEDKNFLLEKIGVELIKSKVDFKKKDSEKNIKKLFNKLRME